MCWIQFVYNLKVYNHIIVKLTVHQSLVKASKALAPQTELHEHPLGVVVSGSAFSSDLVNFSKGQP